MKVKIKNYLTYWGPYQIAQLLAYVGVSDGSCYSIGKWLASFDWLSNTCEYIHSKRKRKISIKIDNFDVWNMDNTLAHIIHPMLVKLKMVKHGNPIIDDEDIPTGLNIRKDEATELGIDEFPDENSTKRWEWVLDEMIWTFEQLKSDDDTAKFYDHSKVDKTQSFCTQIKMIEIDNVGLEEHEARKARGLKFFGKYYQALWD